MTPTIACIIIASEHRRRFVPMVLGSVLSQNFDEVVVVGDWHMDTKDLPTAHRYLCVAPLTRTTNDALVKRDVGALATTADILVYLCDDHILGPHFAAELREVVNEAWGVIVPNRFDRNGRRLNMGERDGYCGGHAGVFRRRVIQTRPWSTMPHHRNWDVLASGVQQNNGARFLFMPRAGIDIIDLLEIV